jgi:hypothetical protein
MAEPEPKPLGRPGLSYISAITAGLINPPQETFWRD